MNEMVQVIERDGKLDYAVMPYGDYLKLLALAESADDVRAFDEAAGQADGESFSAQRVARLVSGDNPVLVWREHRGMSRGALAHSLPHNS